MKKIKFQLRKVATIVACLAVTVSFGYAQDSSEPAITMSFKPNGKVTIFIAGITAAGPVVIDWGDGSPTHTHPLAPLNLMKFDDKVHAVSHSYSTDSDCIISITGKGITSINCSGLGLTSLVLNTPLMWVDCSENQLTSLDVSNSGLLQVLFCNKNQFTSLDVSKNIYLFIFNVTYNQLSSIDVSKNKMLQNLSCAHNQLTSLDVSQNLQLVILDCNENQLTAEAINALFGTLNNTPNKAPTANSPTVPKQINIGGNPGTDACQKNIAQSKNWLIR